jgi:hypothetical protein
MRATHGAAPPATKKTRFGGFFFGVARRDKRAPKGLINRAAPNFVLGREL